MTNRDIGASIGLTHSAISRIRHGRRRPSLEVMEAIAEVHGWALSDQAASRRRGTYAEDFETRVLAPARAAR